MFVNFVKTVNALIKIVSFNQYHEKMKWAGFRFRALIIKMQLNTLLKRVSVNHLQHLHGHLIFTISWHPQFCQNYCWLKKSFRRFTQLIPRFNMVSCFCGLNWNLSFSTTSRLKHDSLACCKIHKDCIYATTLQIGGSTHYMLVTVLSAWFDG